MKAARAYIASQSEISSTFPVGLKYAILRSQITDNNAVHRTLDEHTGTLGADGRRGEFSIIAWRLGSTPRHLTFNLSLVFII